MEIISDLDKAYECAMRRFVRQKSDDPVYLYRVKVARQEMWAVLSAAEAKANKVSIKSSYTAVDGRHGLMEFKHHRQTSENAQYRLMRTAVRGYQQYRRAQEKLEKMERGAEAPVRPTQLDTTEA